VFFFNRGKSLLAINVCYENWESRELDVTTIVGHKNPPSSSSAVETSNLTVVVVADIFVCVLDGKQIPNATEKMVVVLLLMSRAINVVTYLRCENMEGLV